MIEHNVKSIKYYLEGIESGTYEVIDGRITKGGKKLGYVGRNGYLVHATPKYRAYAHRILFAYYYGIGELLKYESINHVDGNKLNNARNNLEGMSLSENSRHQARTGLNAVGSDYSFAILNEIEVVQIKKLLKIGYSQSVLARHYNVHRSTISNISLGNNWKQVEYDDDIEIPELGRKTIIRSDKKLTDKDIDNIRQAVLDKTFTRRELSGKYGVSYSLVRKYTKFL